MNGSAVAESRRLISVAEATSPDAVEAYVGAHPAATAYHSPEWLKVIGRAFTHRTKYLVAQAGCGEVVGALPLVFFSSPVFGRYVVSIPFVNYGGIVADGPDATRALVDAAVREASLARATHLELRHTTQLCPGLQQRRHKVSMRVRLQRSSDEQWRVLDRKLRNQVRKAEKSGLQVRVGHLELLDSFYSVFARNMRDLGTPVYGVRFFREVLSTFPATTRVFVVTLNDRPVAGSVVQWHRDTIEVPWASAVRDFNPLCANVLLYWQMLQFAAEQQFRTFDFGRSTPGEGTFHFKRQWGAEARELVWEYWVGGDRALPDLSPHNPKFALAIRTWQRLPLRLATTLGPHIVRNLP
jgi:FemAB-related protein (PEP-CTERM system-associated)